MDRPEDGEAYAKAKQLWLDQVGSHSEAARIIGNAANFFTLYDPPLSEELLKQAQRLEPSNPHWPECLGRLYSLKSGRGTANARANAANAFREFAAADQMRLESASRGETESDAETIEEKKVQALLSTIDRLPNLAKAAFEAGEFEQARNYASELLEKATSPDLPEFFRNDGNAIHHGNLILGRLALRDGDLEHAKQHLIAAGKTSGSPQLNSFGPNMSLAKEFLEQGARDTVLEYFELCRSFWQGHDSVLDQWAQEIRAGKIPVFGANLRY
jgi:tetratricopeptide (TPR) repeat protein